MELLKKLLRVSVINISEIYNRDRKKATFINELLERIYFLTKFGYLPNFRNPKTLSEFICNQKLYGDFEKMALLADKYAVRDLVEKKIGEKYLIELYGVFESIDEINEEVYNSLPSNFVVKPNHASGRVYINREENFPKFKSDIESFLSGFGENKNELQYNYIKRKLIIEKYINPQKGTLDEYKFWVFNGKVKSIRFAENILKTKKDNTYKNRMYDTEWKTSKFQTSTNLAPKIEKPSCLGKMIEIAEILGEDLELSRIDLYHFDDTIKFGEITLTPSAGRVPYIPFEYEYQLFEELQADANYAT